MSLKIAYSDEYVLTLPEDHKFPIQKYRLIPETLLKENSITEENIFAPPKVRREIVELTHNPDYVFRILSQKLSEREIRKIGFPQSNELVEREFIICGGTIECTKHASEFGVSFNAAGGTHHAFPEHGEGFCLFNDIVVAANYLLYMKLSKKILIIDLDVHQGNGTAKIFENENRVFTFSMHGEANYPLKKEKSDLDIPLKYKTDDETYLNLLYETLPNLIKTVQPDFLFYISGVDILETDKWGRLGMTKKGSKQRDKFVLETAKINNLPIVVTMGGGYSPDIEEIVDAHCNTYRTAIELYK